MDFCSQLCILSVMVWSQLVSHTEGMSWPIMVTSYKVAFNVFTGIVHRSDKTFHYWVTIAPRLTCCCLRSGEFFWLYCWNYCWFLWQFWFENVYSEEQWLLFVLIWVWAQDTHTKQSTVRRRQWSSPDLTTSYVMSFSCVEDESEEGI